MPHDPLTNPNKWDVVRHRGTHGIPGADFVVRAVVEELVAYTIGDNSTVYWKPLADWCLPRNEWEVRHVAD